jgi:outer membrane protein OmpA-like peptidoglycan-associated protein
MYKKMKAAFALIALFSLSACQELEPVQPLSIAIIMGIHANSQAANLANGVLTEGVSASFGTYGMVSVICNDGKPDLISATINDLPERYKHGSPEKLAQDTKRKTNAFLTDLANVRANDAESDMLESLRLAVRSLVSAPAGSQKRIVVLDTGLSTTGLLDFRNTDIFYADPQDIADKLEQKHAIPDFDGITVQWQQLGDVSEPQQPLLPAQVLRLEKIWQAIIEKTGGTFELSLTVANPEKISGDLPPVSLVEFKPDEPIQFDPVAVGKFDTPQFLSEEQVQFIGNSDQFLSPDEAIAVITPIAEYMEATPNFKMLLIGTTAGDNNSDGSLDLSQRRASTVKTTLVSLGVSADRITAIGLGSADPWHIPDAGFDGALAAQNRKVVLISADAPDAQNILD